MLIKCNKGKKGKGKKTLEQLISNVHEHDQED